jgi:hypothetical protein
VESIGRCLTGNYFNFAAVSITSLIKAAASLQQAQVTQLLHLSVVMLLWAMSLNGDTMIRDQRTNQ